MCLCNSFLQARDLTLHYWKYLTYPLGVCTKVVGVLQFDQRVTKNKVSCVFASNNLHTSTLEVVTRPLILPHLRIWVLAEHHHAPIYENGDYRIGSPSSLTYVLSPYVEKMQLVFGGEQPVFNETIYPGLTKIIGYIQALRRLPTNLI